MTTPAKRYREQCAAVAAAQEVDLTTLTPYQRLLKQLHADKAILKDIKSHQDKAQAKADLLPQYAEWLAGVVASGAISESDQITPTLLVWQIDCGLLDETMPLAQIAMTSQAQSPDEFQRTLPEIIVEQYAEKIGAGATISMENLQTVIEWAGAKNENGQHIHNLPDVIRAKALRAAGEFLLETDEPDKPRVLALFSKAVEYNPKIGLKKHIAYLQQNQTETKT